jgi:hypothetical protein
MKARVITFALLLVAVLVGHVMALRWSPEYQTRVRDLEQGFLDFLVANSQESFQKAVPESSADVVFIEYREEDKAEHEAWPPAPLDYFMLMKKLAPASPEVIAFVEPLSWESTDAQFIQQFREQLIPVPSVVLGFEVTSDAVEVSPEQREFMTARMPSFKAGASDPGAATVTFKSVTRLPDKSLQIIGGELGVARVISSGEALPAHAFPFVVSDGTHVVPSLAAQAVSRFRRMASSNLHLRFGTGGRLGLSDTHVVPLERGGTMKLQGKPAVPELDVLELLNQLADEATLAAMARTLGKGKVLVIGSGDAARAQAQAIAQALAVPLLHRAPAWGDWTFAGVMALLSLWQFGRSRIKALLAGVLIAALAAIICMLTFQSSLWWWSPAPAAVVLATSTLFCFLWPRRKNAEVMNLGEGAPAVSEGTVG